MKFLYSSCFASFLLDQDFNIIDKKEFDDVINNNKKLKECKWIKEEKELIKKYENEKIVFIGFKDDIIGNKIENIKINQDIDKFSKISKTLKKQVKKYYSSNTEITKKNVKALIKEDNDVKENFEEMCRNLCSLAGKELGLKLISHAGSLKKLASMPSSKIQLLGAEKALFKHLKHGTPSPKHGMIFHHPLVSKAKNKGKAARLLADKIAIAARIDYFRGKFIGDMLRKQVKEKIK